MIGATAPGSWLRQPGTLCLCLRRRSLRRRHSRCWEPEWARSPCSGQGIGQGRSRDGGTAGVIHQRNANSRDTARHDGGRKERLAEADRTHTWLNNGGRDEGATAPMLVAAPAIVTAPVSATALPVRLVPAVGMLMLVFAITVPRKLSPSVADTPTRQ